MAEAEPHYAAAANAARANIPEIYSTRGFCIANYGRCLQQLGRAVDAGPLLLEALELLSRTVGPTHEDTLRTCASLAANHEERGEREKAAEFRKRARNP